MTALTELAEARMAGSYGNKAAGLAREYGHVAVPPGFVIPGSWICQGMQPGLRSELDGLLAELTSQPRNALEALLTRLEAVLDRVRFSAGQVRQLHALAHRLRLGPVLVVRSSSADEDGSSLSFAGVFDSVVDVDEPDLVRAVEQVWRSGFSRQALAQYRRIGRPPATDHMSVLVQRAIAPQVAGVAFSEPSGDCYLEWTPGHASGLVAGLAVPTGERLSRSSAADGWRQQLRTALAALSEGGGGHDVEWAWDGRLLWIVQVRPRTAGLTGQPAPDGVRITPLYEGDLHDLVLGECAGEYTRIRAKRRLARAIAISQGARVPGGWLANWDRTGPVEPLTAWSKQLPGRLVIDSSPTERQYIIGSAELADTVRRLADAAPGEGDFAFLCREYIRGETALLSTVATDGSVYVEASEEGLLALNRGFGSAHPITGEALNALLGPEQARALEGTTREHARRIHPRATLEWVVEDGSLLFVDYSAPVTGPAAPKGGHGVTGARVLSAGVASGRVQVLSIDDILTESSIAPIISIAQPVSAENEALLLSHLRQRLSLDGTGVIIAVSRPIAVLSMLLGVVDGFLFEEGALLSHLGILLREAGVPAAIVGTGNLPPEGSFVEIVHGTVLAVTDDAHPAHSPAGG
ncbi:PEP/pyruvate-binding domain-containing protein [Jatrophihabitans sp.]|uniref:PEP/pyruvate-binding domain-containing protein n=1 Tax=Jatrophihabitans sp. TaxID=1932789 RepID=UPI002F23FDEC